MTKAEREEANPNWSVHTCSLSAFKEECYGVVTFETIERMFRGNDISIQQLLEGWIAFFTQEFGLLIEVIDIVLKYTSLLLVTSTSPTVLRILSKFFDELLFVLIERKYLLSLFFTVAIHSIISNCPSSSRPSLTRVVPVTLKYELQ